MKKVVVIAECEFGNHIYYHLLHLLPALSRNKDITVEVMVPNDSPLIPALNAYKIKTHAIENFSTEALSRADIKAMRAKLKDIKPDIVHTHSDFPGRISTQFGRYKAVHTLHSVIPISKWRKRFPFKQLFKPSTHTLANRVIAVNQAVKNSLIDLGVSDKMVRLIYNGVAPAKQLYTPEIIKLRVRYNIPTDYFVVTYIAKLQEENNQDFVLNTARELPYNVMTLLVGDGYADEEYEKHLRTRIQAENLQNARILPPGNLDEILAITDVQVSPVTWQRIPSHVLSGMSIGKPPIVTKHFDSHVIQDEITGLTFEANSVEWLDDAITRIKDDRGMYKRLSQAAQGRYAKNFTAEIMARETTKVYEELM